MNSRQRVEATLRRERPDRTAIAGWRHFPMVDRNVEAFVAKTIEFTDRNHWDIVKLMSQGQYFLEAYGLDMTFSTDPMQWGASIRWYLVNSPEDLKLVRPLTRDNPVFCREAAFTQGVARHYQGEKVLLGTLFSPLSWVKQLSPGNPAIRNLQPEGEVSPIPDFVANHKEELHSALRALTQSNKVYMDMQIEAGVDGFFLAEHYSSRDELSSKDFAEFCKPYLHEMLDYVKDRTWCNLLHVHGLNELRFEELIDLPVQILNWEDHMPAEDAPGRRSIADVRAMTQQTLMGGIERFQDFSFTEDREQIKQRIRLRYRDALNQSAGFGFIFAPGCAFPLSVDEELYSLIYEVVSEEQE